MSPVVIKQKLLAEIEQLPEDRLREVLDFVQFLKWQPGYRGFEYQLPDNDQDNAEDPILRFIGGVSHGSLAQNIDEELYER